MDIQGTVAPGFEPVREAFEANFATRGELGAAVCATHQGRVVVDLCAGLADPATGAPWTPDTMINVFSATKGLAALALLMLQDRGLLDPSAPMAEYWPESTPLRTPNSNSWACAGCSSSMRRMPATSPSSTNSTTKRKNTRRASFAMPGTSCTRRDD